MSPFRPSFPPQPRVFSQPPLALQPNFYASCATSFLSMICRLLVSLRFLFRARFLCFHQLAASFCKIPGVWYPGWFCGMPGGVGYLGGTSAPSAPRRYPLPLFFSPRCATLPTEHTPRFSRRPLRPLSTFRINTCKSVSKQTTLTPFRMNTYEKPRVGGGGGTPVSRDFTRHSPLVTSPITCTTRRLYPAPPQSIAHSSRRHGGGTPFPRFQPGLASV